MSPTKTKAKQKQQDIQDKVGKSHNDAVVKDLVGARMKKQTKEILNNERKTRAQTVEAGMTFKIGILYIYIYNIKRLRTKN